MKPLATVVLALLCAAEARRNCAQPRGIVRPAAGASRAMPAMSSSVSMGFDSKNRILSSYSSVSVGVRAVAVAPHAASPVVVVVVVVVVAVVVGC